ncbi:hypothetical protein [Psychrobacter sp. AOP31-A1-22]|uniref:hypothetical protein n=1 Tax=Psychrobacter sp. AOP31-A1-22 TaxID=3457696 RepID=UPI0040358EAE
MGNRATITLSADKKDRGVYVHWNGGRGSIAAFLDETQKRMSMTHKTVSGGDIDTEVDEEAITTFYSIFYGVAREFFGYSSKYKERDPDSIYMASEHVRKGTSDNGCYVIKNDFTCGRIDKENFSEYDANCYQHITQFFDEVHHALCAVVAEETDHYKDPDFSLEQIAHHLACAEEIERNAANRAERLRNKFKAKQAEEAEVVTDEAEA